MASGKGKTTGKKTVRKEESSKYINPLTDFGFKYIFGAKESMINFLNAILEIEGGIVDLTYDNTERIPHSEEERKAQFDLHCTTGTGERIIIEMQNHSQYFFKDRTIYYVTFPIQEQAPKGKDWDFMLKPVYSVNIVNFRMYDVEPQESKELEEQYISYVQLIDRYTKQIFYKKLTLAYLKLPLFTKTEDELQTGVDQWMFVLKNLSNLNDLPDALRNEVFEQLFRMAEVAKLSAKDRKEYYRSLKSYRDMNNSIAQRDQKIVQRDQIIAQRDQTIVQRDRRIADLKQENAAYRQENVAYQQEIAELRRRLGLNDINVN